jgi:hypothetical protein
MELHTRVAGLTAEGRVVLQLKSPWSGGTSHLVFEPVDFWLAWRPSSPGR